MIPRVMRLLREKFSGQHKMETQRKLGNVLMVTTVLKQGIPVALANATCPTYARIHSGLRLTQLDVVLKMWAMELL